MKTELEDIINKLENDFYQNEEHVRLSLVSRILKFLDWDIWNPREVNTEFVVVPKEDSTRVDIALFLNPYAPPSVYMEIKSVGKVEYQLGKIETQLRDYNRNNTSMFTILTDGRIWKFYYSQTGGEFSNKCFKTIDLFSDDIEDIESSFYTFLSKTEIESENAKAEAESYLQLSQRQRALEDALPKAKRLTLESPFPSLPEAIINIVSSAGFSIGKNEVIKFIQENTIDKTESRTTSFSKIQKNTTIQNQSSVKSGKNSFPPESTICKFEYKGEEYRGDIENNSLNVDGFGRFTSFSSASKEITKTSRNGWFDWLLKIPGNTEWLLADKWRNK